MPANRVVETVYLDRSGSYDSFNQATLYKPGELGARAVDTTSKEYQLVRLDSGATSATALGVVAANQLAFWKDKTNFIVTNDTVQALGANTVAATNSGFRNEVAGIFRVAVTAGNYCFVLRKGENVNVKSASATYQIGDQIVANTGTAADCNVVAAGTAVVVQSLGTAAGARVSGNTPTDLNIPNDIS